MAGKAKNLKQINPQIKLKPIVEKPINLQNEKHMLAFGGLFVSAKFINPFRCRMLPRMRYSPKPLKLTMVDFRAKINENSTPKMPAFISSLSAIVFSGSLIPTGRYWQPQ
jgi:hypothetical protein